MLRKLSITHQLDVTDPEAQLRAERSGTAAPGTV